MKLELDLLDLTSIGENITVLAITGGPGSGKTTAGPYLYEKLTDRGYKVLMKGENARKHIDGGIKPWEISGEQFQRGILLDTLCEEQMFLQAAIHYRDLGRKVVLLCDRGTMDGEAYVHKPEFAAMVRSMGFSFGEICEKRYHAVIHMRTAALGAEKFYVMDKARVEEPEKAREVDQRTLEAWQRHAHCRVIDNSTDWDLKLRRLFEEVCAVLGDPIPLEIEDKYLIKNFTPSDIPENFCVFEITQDYLLSPNPDEEQRVRRRRDEDGDVFFHTIKIGKGKKRHERERMITESVYHSLLNSKDPDYNTIVKDRITFFWKEHFFEVDLFMKPSRVSNLQLMEVEYTRDGGVFELPPFINVIKKVTGHPDYSNKEIARRK